MRRVRMRPIHADVVEVVRICEGGLTLWWEFPAALTSEKEGNQGGGGDASVAISCRMADHVRVDIEYRAECEGSRG